MDVEDILTIAIFFLIIPIWLTYMGIKERSTDKNKKKKNFLEKLLGLMLMV